MPSRMPCALFVLAVVIALPALAIPDLPPPPQSMVAPAGNNMKLNGVTVSVRHFRSQRNVSEVIQFYRDEFPASLPEDPGVLVTDVLQPWTVISRMEDGYLLTVQTKPEGRGSSGILAISKPPNDPDLQDDMGKRVPKMDGSDVISDLETKDDGKKGRVVLVTNDHSVKSNADFYRERYLAEGWTPVMDQNIDNQMHTLAFNDMGQKVNIVAMRGQDGGAVVMINVEKTSWF
ncbi:MAG: hypothetical protein AAF384_01085 [Pseudomonadota bacterium]